MVAGRVCRDCEDGWLEWWNGGMVVGASSARSSVGSGAGSGSVTGSQAPHCRLYKEG